MTKEQFAEKMPARLDKLHSAELLRLASDATEAAKDDLSGWLEKPALWQLAAACLNERASRTMLFLTKVIAVLTVIVTLATVYQVLCK